MPSSPGQAAAVACAGAEVKQVVRGGNHLAVMLDKNVRLGAIHAIEDGSVDLQAATFVVQ